MGRPKGLFEPSAFRCAACVLSRVRYSVVLSGTQWLQQRSLWLFCAQGILDAKLVPFMRKITRTSLLIRLVHFVTAERADRR
jgi:hypothetical protein